jgi:hypothetical protein
MNAKSAPMDATSPSQNVVLIANRILAGLATRDALLVCGLTAHRGVGPLALAVMRAAAALSGRGVIVAEAQAGHPAATVAAAGAPGFTDLMAGDAFAPSMLHALPGHTAVRYLGIGTRPALAGPGALMSGAAAARAVAALRAEADLVCCIAAPLARSVATAGLARHLGAGVLCLHRGLDRRDDIARAVGDLAASGTRLIGTLLLR